MECYHPPTSHLPRDLIVLYCMTLNLSYPVRMEGGQGRALAYRATYRALARLKASRPLIRVLVINVNGLWINDFI